MLGVRCSMFIWLRPSAALLPLPLPHTMFDVGRSMFDVRLVAAIGRSPSPSPSPFDAPPCGVNSTLAPPQRGWAFGVRLGAAIGRSMGLVEFVAALPPRLFRDGVDQLLDEVIAGHAFGIRVEVGDDGPGKSTPSPPPQQHARAHVLPPCPGPSMVGAHELEAATNCTHRAQDFHG